MADLKKNLEYAASILEALYTEENRRVDLTSICLFLIKLNHKLLHDFIFHILLVFISLFVCSKYDVLCG